MVGKGLKKLAEENNMKVANGVAYGDLHGYAATLSEGSGYKLMVITTKFTDKAKADELQKYVEEKALDKEYRIQKMVFAGDAIIVKFFDNPGTMKKIRSFTDWFFPLLVEYSALGTNYCNECEREFAGDGTWKLINGSAFHVHEACAQRMERSAVMAIEQRKQEDTGSYGGGFVGALVGSFLGAIVWAIVLYFGFFASIIGLLIGWLAKKGYEIFHGKNGKGKFFIVLVTAIVGVLLGTFMADAITLAVMIRQGEIPWIGYRDIIPFIGMLLMEDSEYLFATLGDVGMGLVFAILGMFNILRETKYETSEFEMKDLE